MIDADERWYYINRARASREAAEAATDPLIANIHLELRRRYLEKADNTPLRLAV